MFVFLCVYVKAVKSILLHLGRQRYERSVSLKYSSWTPILVVAGYLLFHMGLATTSDRPQGVWWEFWEV